MFNRIILIIAALSGMFSVALGAFAAHGLKASLAPYLLSVFETGVHYQFIHSLAVILCVVLAIQVNGPKQQKAFHRAAICFIIGILFFSGSLYPSDLKMQVSARIAWFVDKATA